MLEPFVRPNPMPQFRDAVERDKILKRALEFYRNDMRVHAFAQSCAAMACQELDEDGDTSPREAAIEAVAIAVARIYFEDSEIHTLKAERDHYRKVAEDALLIGPLRLVVPSDSGSHPEGENGEAG